MKQWPVEKSGVCLFISSHRYHRKVQDRLGPAAAVFEKVILVSFERGAKNDDESYTNVDFISLGSQVDGLGLRRISTAASMLLTMLSLRRKLGKIDVLVANNAELMIFAELVFGKTLFKIYDLADIHRLQYEGRWWNVVFRSIERWALKNGWRSVVTSPWFYWNYIVAKLGIFLPTILIENCLRAPLSVAIEPRVKVLGSNVTILWNGFLRCSASAKLLAGLLKALPTLTLRIAGDCTRVIDQFAHFAGSGRVEVYGQYREADLALIADGCQYIWGIDLSDGLNSQTLLPNRLYHGIYYAVPVLGYGITAVGKVIKYNGLGPVFPSVNIDEVANILVAISADQYGEFVESCLKLRESAIRDDMWERTLGQGVHAFAEGQSLSQFEDVRVVLARGATQGNDVCQSGCK